MLNVFAITISNFLSVGQNTQAIRLDQHGLTLILGSNTDANGGITRNGAGKTTILQALSFVLFGKPLTKIKADNLVNNINNKRMLVTVEFERAGTKYRIERGRKPQILRFFVNDKEHVEEATDLSQGENRHTQEEIERVLGMTHTMFSHIVALNTFTEPFLRMSVANQRMVIEELLGVTQLSSRADTLKKLIAQTKEEVRDQEALIKATTEANSRIEATIRTTLGASTMWKTKHEQAIKRLASEIEAVESIDYDAELAAFDALDTWREAERALRTTLDQKKVVLAGLMNDERRLSTDLKRTEADMSGASFANAVSRLQAEIERKEKDIERYDLQAGKVREELKAVEHDLTHSDEHTCRSCGQGLTGTDHLEKVMANLEKQKKTLTTKLGREETEATARRREIEELQADIAEVMTKAEAESETLRALFAKQQAEHTDACQAVKATQIEVNEANAAVTALGKAPQTVFDSRDEVYKAKGAFDMLVRDLEIETAKENPYADQLESLKETIQTIDYTALNDLQDLFKHQELLLKLLTNKDSFIRKKIVDQNLHYLNTRLNHYLERLGLPHEVRFLPDLTVEITQLGRDFDFEQLSRGEMNRVIMATSWSFRDVWESLNESVNLYFIDEVLDQGTDTHGAEAALGILNAMARDRKKNVFLISHRDELVGRIDRTLLVRKENGYSRFEEDVTT